jgi:tetratricopeptide (TPR) repeat protein
MNAPTSLILADAESLYESGQCDQAVALLAEAYLKDRSHLPSLEKLAEFLIDSGRYESALEWLLHAEDGGGYPRMNLLMAVCKEALGDLLSARILVEKVEHDETLSAEALSLKGRIALAGNDFAEAEMLFQQAAAQEEGCASGWFGLSRIHNLKGDVDRSFHCLAKAFLVNPQSREISTALHDITLVTNKMAESEAIFQQTLRERPKNRRLRFFLIDLLLRQSRFSDAMGEIERSLADFGVDAGLLAAAVKVRQRLGPLEINQSRKGQNSVSLCMIVKNERDHLSRCSVKPFVDEIIIVDTGSTDETKEIALVFGACVYDYVWSEDFSEARNFALSMAKGDWVLVLDADEVLSAADTEKFKQTLNSAPAKPSAFRIQTRNYSNKCNTFNFKTNQGEFFEEQGIGWYPSDKVRLFTNDPRIRFEYPVHELVEPSLKRSNIPVQDCPLVVHHYGTLEDDKTLKKTRNYCCL